MAQYKVKATIKVEYDAEYSGKMASALEDVEDKIITTLSETELLQSCEIKKSKNSVGRLLKRRKRKMNMELKQEIIGGIAKRHIEFIKSRGEKGISATESLAAYEKVSLEAPVILETLRTEYSVIEALASAMKAEIERMEEES